jgi:hypothetical protein
MKTLAILCNSISVFFTCLVLATDGPPTRAAYIILTVLMLLIPVFTVFALARSGGGGVPFPRGGAIVRATAFCNVVLLGLFCLALVRQYPHPAEPGFLEYVVLMMVTPVLSAVVLFRIARGGRRAGTQMKGETLPQPGETR